MSTEPVGAEGKIVSKTYYHLYLKPKDWCTYFKGPCAIENNIGPDYCWACKYRKKLDIPDLLVERGKS